MGKDSTDLDDLIENVAIATVGDVMDLEDENRIFVKEGLQMLKRTKNPGLKASIVDSIEEVKEFLDQEGMDISGMSDEEIEEASEVFALPDGRYLIVEG